MTSKERIYEHALDMLLDAVSHVLAYDWHENDEDAVDSIDDLKRAARQFETVRKLAAETIL